MHTDSVFQLADMEMEGFKQKLSLQKEGDGGFENTDYLYSCTNDIF